LWGPHAANGQSAHQPAQQQQQQQPTLLSQFNSQQGLPEIGFELKINPQTPLQTKIENLINF
jgi:hypothetical protein